MESRICGRHKGFSLVEIAVVLLLFGVAAAYMVISPNVAKQTAKHEAERLEAYIYRQMYKSERIHQSFVLEIGSTYIYTNWENHDKKDTSYTATSGCKYGKSNDITIRYSADDQRFPIGTSITVWGADGETYYVVLATANEGRIRISETKP